MSPQDQKIFDELDRAFDEMEIAMKRLKEGGYRELAEMFGSKWVIANDQFHEARALGNCYQFALNKLESLEDDICKTLKEFGLVPLKR